MVGPPDGCWDIGATHSSMTPCTVSAGVVTIAKSVGSGSRQQFLYARTPSTLGRWELTGYTVTPNGVVSRFESTDRPTLAAAQRRRPPRRFSEGKMSSSGRRPPPKRLCAGSTTSLLPLSFLIARPMLVFAISQFLYGIPHCLRIRHSVLICRPAVKASSVLPHFVFRPWHLRASRCCGRISGLAHSLHSPNKEMLLNRLLVPTQGVIAPGSDRSHQKSQSPNQRQTFLKHFFFLVGQLPPEPCEFRPRRRGNSALWA